MDLQISVFLLFSLFTAGRSLSCFQCGSDSCSFTTCTRGFTNCSSTTAIFSTTVTKVRGCIPASDCVNGFINLGIIKGSSSCCNTDLCNIQDAPDFSKTPNGIKCYSCDLEAKQNCTHRLSCSGSEDRCLTGAFGVNQTLVVKGCASKSVCDAAAALSGVDIGNVSCCEGNLCNGAPSVSQSFLFLCCSLLSYFLLH